MALKHKPSLYTCRAGADINMSHIYLVRHEPDRNLHRFYQMFVTPGIFEEWSLIREWGRIGSPGTVRKDWYETEASAIEAYNKLYKIKLKKGYESLSQKINNE